MSVHYELRNEMSPTKTVASRSSDLINVTEARKILGISANKMAALIGSGVLPFEHDELDNRVKLVKRKDVENLMSKRNNGKPR
jgi:hypothetical protein